MPSFWLGMVIILALVGWAGWIPPMTYVSPRENLPVHLVQFLLPALAVGYRSSALLIGKHGQTLDAIEYILNRIVVRESGSTARIEVDVEGYRARRAESLVATARRMAEKVRETGRPATVDLMNPRDRRIVHMALKDEGGVTSRSQGDGFLRKLIILPAGKRRNGPRSARDGE